MHPQAQRVNYCVSLLLKIIPVEKAAVIAYCVLTFKKSEHILFRNHSNFNVPGKQRNNYPCSHWNQRRAHDKKKKLEKVSISAYLDCKKLPKLKVQSTLATKLDNPLSCSLSLVLFIL